MPLRPSDIIRRGAPMTGRSLLSAIETAGIPPRSGPGIVVTSSAQQVAVRRSGHPIIPTGRGLPVVLQAATALPAPAVNRWDYAWKTAKLDAVTLNYVVMVPADAGYLTSTFASLFPQHLEYLALSRTPDKGHFRVGWKQLYSGWFKRCAA